MIRWLCPWWLLHVLDRLHPDWCWASMVAWKHGVEWNPRRLDCSDGIRLGEHKDGYCMKHRFSVEPCDLCKCQSCDGHLTVYYLAHRDQCHMHGHYKFATTEETPNQKGEGE